MYSNAINSDTILQINDNNYFFDNKETFVRQVLVRIKVIFGLPIENCLEFQWMTREHSPFTYACFNVPKYGGGTVELFFTNTQNGEA